MEIVFNKELIPPERVAKLFCQFEPVLWSILVADSDQLLEDIELSREVEESKFLASIPGFIGKSA